MIIEIPISVMTKLEIQKENVGKLIEEYEPQLKAFIRTRVSNKDDVEDVLQDVFYQFVKTVENAMNPIEHVTAWLYRVARNTIINKNKKLKEEEWPVSLSEDSKQDGWDEISEVLFNSNNSDFSPETEYMRSLIWEELTVALSELPPEQKEAFELMDIEGIPAKEIAEITGIPVNTLLSRKHYALKYLRKRLKGLYEDLILY